MNKLKYILVAALTSTLSFGVAATTGVAAHERASPSLVEAHPGDIVIFWGLDLMCHTYRTDPDHNFEGPVFSCSSWHGSARAIGGNKHAFWVSNASGTRTILVVGRTP